MNGNCFAGTGKGSYIRLQPEGERVASIFYVDENLIAFCFDLIGGLKKYFATMHPGVVIFEQLRTEIL